MIYRIFSLHRSSSLINSSGNNHVSFVNDMESVFCGCKAFDDSWMLKNVWNSGMQVYARQEAPWWLNREHPHRGHLRGADHDDSHNKHHHRKQVMKESQMSSFLDSDDHP